MLKTPYCSQIPCCRDDKSKYFQRGQILEIYQNRHVGNSEEGFAVEDGEEDVVVEEVAVEVDIEAAISEAEVAI